MKTRSLETLFRDTLKDIDYAERKILRALPKMARGAQSPKPARGRTCPAIDGIIEEGEAALVVFADGPALNARLIAASPAGGHFRQPGRA